MSIKHGVYVTEEDTALSVPVSAPEAIVVIGTTPINLAEDPAAAVNVPVLANSATEAMQALGYSTDFKKYTACQAMYTTGNLFPVSPVVYINVLDPAKHKKDIEEKSFPVQNKQATIKEEGVVLSSLTIKAATATLKEGTDYTAEFDSDGYAVITLISGGAGDSAESLNISGVALDPSAVTKEDIIGSYDASTGKETGAQLIRQVYPRLGVVPGLIIAPGWSQVPEVGIALAAKASQLNGCFKAMALVDLDTTKAKKYTDTKQVKEDSGFTSAFCYPLWPLDKVGDIVVYKSATVAALCAFMDANNDGVPSLSPSNTLLGVTGQCLEDGTEVYLDQEQANTVNSYGVTTAINLNGWRLWGNYTGAFPGESDPKDIWFAVRRMFNWHANSFILTYFDEVDDPMNAVLIQSVVDSENIRCASYAPDKWAGASIEYRLADNPVTNIAAGKVVFRQKIAPYTPAQEIDNVVSFDLDLLSTTLAAAGGES